MFCSNCGAQVADGAAFCPSCGKPLATQPADVAQPTQVAAPLDATQVTGAAQPDAGYPTPVPTQPAAYGQPTQAYTPVEPVQPTQVMPQAIPQPTASQPATSGASSQPSYAQQPQQQPYAQQPYGYQPAQPTQQPAKKKPIVPIVAGVAAVAVVGALAMHFLGGSGGTTTEPTGTGGSSEPIVQVPQVPEATTTDPEPEPEPEPQAQTPQETTQPETTVTYDAEALDVWGNPTAYAVDQMTGADIAAMLESQGWEWDADSKWFISSDGNDCFYVSGPNDYEYTYEGIKGLSAFANGESAVFVTVVDDRDYSSASSALSSLTPVVVEETQWLNDEQTAGMAVLYGPSMRETIAIVSYEENPGLYSVSIFNPEAIESGMIDEWLGDNYGRSVDEIWTTIFGHTPGN